MEMGLKGTVAVVTGASKGLGAAIVRAYAQEGMKIVATARNGEELKKNAEEFPGQIVIFEGDVCDPARAQELVDLAIASFGRLDCIVSNAGIAPAANFLEMSIETWHEVFSVNLFAPVALSKAAGPIFIEQGHGKIIHIASTSGLRGKPSLAAYSSSKGALLRFTEALSGEWAKFNIQVNAIAPGAFHTDAQQAVTSNPEVLNLRLRKIPAGRMGDPNEIGYMSCYLASEQSNFVTGATFVIDGGESAKL